MHSHAIVFMKTDINPITERDINVYEELEDNKGVLRIRKSKKDRQHNDQKKKDKRTNNDL